MIRTHALRNLTLEPAAGRTHISAASALVACGRFLYVVADDEHALGVFAADGDAPGHLHRLLDEPLPAEHALRKARKADFEILLRLPSLPGAAHGVLLAMGSGSTPQRDRAAWLRLDATGALLGDSHVLDLAPLYTRLRLHLPALNLEAAAIVGDALILLHRASGADRRNAYIRLPLAYLLHAIERGTVAPDASAAASLDALSLDTIPIRITRIDLGDIDGAPLGFTDAAALDDGRLVFSAAAEAADDAYADGPLRGAAVGWLTPAGDLGALHRLDVVLKVEGIAVQQLGDVAALRLVTDADDPDVPAQLLTATLPLTVAPQAAAAD